MKITLSLILTVFVLLFSQYSSAQAICGFDAMHAKLMKENPSYRKNVLAGEAFIQEYIRQHPVSAPAPRRLTTSGNPTSPVTSGNPTTSGNPAGKPITSGAPTTPVTLSGPPYQIPVVVHVIHTGGPVGSIYNPTDAQILGALNYLNAVYNGTDAGMDAVNGAGDIQIQFVLAQRDPNCNPTNGINRVDGSGVAGYLTGGINQQTTSGADESNVKALSDWDNTRYYNVWIVNKIDGNDGTTGQFIAGYAYMPGAPANIDGIVMLATQMVAGQKTLPHEIGHAFNLYHPFQGSIQGAPCPSNSNCSMDGDKVCDTDPVPQNIDFTTGVIDFTCRTGLPDSCTMAPFAVNTESNFMSYTNCYTLFTPGQKTRMQAGAALPYRSTLTTSSGGLPPSAGGTGCSPKIDFELSGDQQTEVTATTAGCRSYKDYSYNMVIGISPSATATVTLSVTAGSAVRGVDYDFTTNGNFTTPSQQLTFLSGSTTSQPFTIRIYDDASVNGARSFTLGFSISTGGNAIAGDGRPNFKMVIYDNDKAPFGPTTDTTLVGSDQGGLTGPLGPSSTTSPSKKNKSQMLYYASELTAAGVKTGNLTGLSLDIDKASASGYIYHGMTIKIAATAQGSLYNGGGQFPLSEASFTTVYSSDYASVNGWNNFIFSTPFAWNGSSNIVVEICYDNSANSLDVNDLCEGYFDGNAVANYIFATVNCGTAIGSFNFFTDGGGNPIGIKPLIRLLTPDPGTAVQTILNSSQSQYLGPNSDVYFYDQSNGQLMARIQNLSSFDYGCTQVVVDRAGNNATAFWNNNIPNYLMDKTFHVLPTTNNSSGNYNITLYYTKGEVDGWTGVTGQSIGSIQIVKVPNQISNVTPANPTGGGAVTLVTPSISTIGTNTGLTYNFTNGFSGFGAGVPGLSSLPIGLTNFDGRLAGNDAVLQWTTSFESGNKGFEIDRSFDGNNFSKIGFVNGVGNSSTPQNYTFTDPSLTHDNDYYRLQQIDLDGKSTFSKIVLVNKSGGASSFTVLPNPFSDNLDLLFGQAPAGNVQIRLLDITGRELLRQSGSASAGGRLHIDLSGGVPLSAGVYLLEVRFDNKTQIEKLIKK